MIISPILKNIKYMIDNMFDGSIYVANKLDSTIILVSGSICCCFCCFESDIYDTCCTKQYNEIFNVSDKPEEKTEEKTEEKKDEILDEFNKIKNIEDCNMKTHITQLISINNCDDIYDYGDNIDDTIDDYDYVSSNLYNDDINSRFPI